MLLGIFDYCFGNLANKNLHAAGYASIFNQVFDRIQCFLSLILIVGLDIIFGKILLDIA